MPKAIDLKSINPTLKINTFGTIKMMTLGFLLL